MKTKKDASNIVYGASTEPAYKQGTNEAPQNRKDYEKSGSNTSLRGANTRQTAAAKSVRQKDSSVTEKMMVPVLSGNNPIEERHRSIGDPKEH